MLDIFYFDKTVKRGKIKDIKKFKNKLVWVDVINITLEECGWLTKVFNLHPLTAENLFHSNTRIKVEEFPHYLYCVFYGIKKNNTSIKHSFELIELDFVLGKNFIITNHFVPINSSEELKNNKEILKTLFKEGIEFIFHKILDDEVDNYFPVLEEVDDMLDKMEEVAAKKAEPETFKNLLNLKRQIVNIKRITFPQRDKISFLAKNRYKFISNKAIPYFRDIYDHSIRVSDSIDYYRDSIGSAFEIYMSTINNKLNEVMKWLSMIATITLPMSVISSIYGTNFLNLPGSSYYYGFWIMIGVMILLCFGIVYYFKKKKWI